MNTRLDTKVRIQGTLSPSSKETVKSNTHNKVADALKANGLKSFTTEKHWAQGIIAFNEQTFSFGGRHVALGIVNAMRDFIKAEGVAGLQLEGKLMVMVDTCTGPVVVRVTIEDSKLRYQQSVLTWEPELVA
jgi:hypothetical protein